MFGQRELNLARQAKTIVSQTRRADLPFLPQSSAVSTLLLTTGDPPSLRILYFPADSTRGSPIRCAVPTFSVGLLHSSVASGLVPMY